MSEFGLPALQIVQQQKRFSCTASLTLHRRKPNFFGSWPKIRIFANVFIFIFIDYACNTLIVFFTFHYVYSKIM